MRSLSTGWVEVPFSARFHFARSGRNPDGMPVERLRMVQRWAALTMSSRTPAGGSGGERPLVHRTFAHRPVMVEEVVDLLAATPPGTVLDATVGGGGHARALLAAAPHLGVVGLDRDADAVAAARAALEEYGPRARVEQARFDDLAGVLAGLGVAALSGALFDLGVSSPQLDRPERGFSYRAEGPLDMRMDRRQPVSASDVVNGWAEADLARLFAEHGEPRFARRVARAVVAGRPLRTTSEFAAVVRDAIPAAARRTGGHPARRVFQAVRIAVNEELAVLPTALDDALDLLSPGGRCVVLSYHSGEDRIVKDRFRHAATGGCTCPPGLPCVCGATPTVRLLTRGARRPSPAEVAANRRSESARLRSVERLPAEPPDASGSPAARRRP